ncbi:hypothetical protein DL89DRAFT_164728 [Linderina pennispora]|uniref:Secreted protein n=1 Tax=Linderina pennispora TaxID=61395 RepID=A0A1Y1W955_9FUNG|nr:uncharacterized protein DL89DRAFT_164728 [Linderina pennispora]ORX69694.1 hypothetical protein DL89DRAFT_164728 [Linderina pennispora]
MPMCVKLYISLAAMLLPYSLMPAMVCCDAGTAAVCSPLSASQSICLILSLHPFSSRLRCDEHLCVDKVTPRSQLLLKAHFSHDFGLGTRWIVNQTVQRSLYRWSARQAVCTLAKSWQARTVAALCTLKPRVHQGRR